MTFIRCDMIETLYDFFKEYTPPTSMASSELDLPDMLIKIQRIALMPKHY